MLTFFFNPLGRAAQYDFILGWLFWMSLELGCFFGLWAAAENSPAAFYWFIVLTSVSGMSAVSIFILGVKRLRDAAMPLWLAAILLIPGISIIALVVMSNLPTRTDNGAG